MANQALTESYSGGTLAGLAVNHAFDNYLRSSSVEIKSGSTSLQAVSYAHDNAGRLQSVTDASASSHTATYAYHANSHLINTLTFTNSGSGNGMVTTKAYDRLNRLQSIASNAFGSSAPSLPVSFAYQYNAANQRIRADLEDGSYWIYQYDALGQVVLGRKYWADNTAVDGQQFDYAFDDIGNRTTTGGRTSAVSTYTRNFLNQYSQRTVSDKADALGVANPTAGVTVGIQGGTAYTAARKGDYFHYPLKIGNNVYPTIEVKSLYGATQTETGEIFNPPATETFTHDADGNLTQDGRWTYLWDGENRLVEMYRDTSTPTLSSRLRLTFEYDHQGRRIRKTFFTHNGTTWVEQADTVFLYDGWNLLGELDANASNAKLRTYVWGLDLSGTMEGGGLPRQSGAAAGGVRGLLKLTDYTSGTTHHFVAYDGNGNVIALVAGASGAITARYEYGPFGEPLRRTGNLARNNPFRFSTKFTENESGLVYYGYRYFHPGSAAWLSRDPQEENGGLNLYLFVQNNPITHVDVLEPV
ncbi:MAG: RHS repeat-associated core domain-containing protein [Verrucomicrobiota bacterium]